MKTLRVVLTTIFSVFVLLGAVFVLLLLFGYRPVSISNSLPDWNAVNAIAACISALAAISIPVVVFVLEKRIKQREEETRDVLLKELSDFKSEYEDKLKVIKDIMDGNINVIFNGGNAYTQ